jgi:molybdopterin synthase catalytic subunit
VRYEISEEPLELAPLIALVRSDACGAIVAFLGVVRETGDGERPVDGLAYEAYPEMALPELRAVGEEAAHKFGPARVAIVHRIGKLELGEASVAIAVAAPHRAQAFDACEFAIDELKRRVPIWKKEFYRDGESSWRANEPRPA